jgi:hypothetical protein
MQRDEVSQKIIVAVLGQDKSEGRNIANSNKARLPFLPKILHLLRTTKSRSHQITAKMLKLQIPKDQVLQRMKKEGIEERSSLLSASNCSNLGGWSQRTLEEWKQTCFTSLDSIVRKSVGQSV